MEDYFAKARSFIFSHGRLLERHLFRYLFEEGSAELVSTSVKAYQNPDGGFGHALEPDKRTPSSQPVDVEFAFYVLDDIRLMDDPAVEPACDFLLKISTPNGESRFLCLRLTLTLTPPGGPPQKILQPLSIPLRQFPACC